MVGMPRCIWQDTGFAEDGAVEGEIRTKYHEKDLSSAIDYVMKVSERFGLEMSSSFYLTMETNDTIQPELVLKIIKGEASKRGWDGFYDVEE